MGAADAGEWACVLCGRRIQNDWVEQQICIKFCMKLEHSLVESVWMIQKTTAMGCWWLAASSQQRACSCITSRAVFLRNVKSPRWLRFGALRLLAFPQTKITFEKVEISDHRWDSGKYNGAAGGDWENCVRSQSTYFEGDWGINVLCTFLISSSINVYFSYYMVAYLLDRPCLWTLTNKTNGWIN